MSRVPPARSTRHGASEMIFIRKLYYTAGHIQNPRDPADGRLVRWILIGFAVLPAGLPQTLPDPGQLTKAAMSVSLEKQRVSITRQVDALVGRPATPAESFFTVPWIDFPSFALPPCDPLPADQLDQLVSDSSKQEGVQPDLIRAVINQERSEERRVG